MNSISIQQRMHAHNISILSEPPQKNLTAMANPPEQNAALYAMAANWIAMNNSDPSWTYVMAKKITAMAECEDNAALLTMASDWLVSNNRELSRGEYMNRAQIAFSMS